MKSGPKPAPVQSNAFLKNQISPKPLQQPKPDIMTPPSRFPDETLFYQPQQGVNPIHSPNLPSAAMVGGNMGLPNLAGNLYKVLPNILRIGFGGVKPADPGTAAQPGQTRKRMDFMA